MALYAIVPPEPHAARRGEPSSATEPAVPLSRVKQIVAVIVLVFSAMLIFLAIDGLTMNMRLTLAVFVATITAWTILDLPDTPVALAGAATPWPSSAQLTRTCFTGLSAMTLSG